MDDIPDGFIDRQLNDSRYISKLVKGLMSKIVREKGEEEATSKNVIVCTGGITDRLKRTGASTTCGTESYCLASKDSTKCADNNCTRL